MNQSNNVLKERNNDKRPNFYINGSTIGLENVGMTFETLNKNPTCNNKNNNTTSNNNIYSNNSPQFYQQYSSSPTHLFMNPEALVPQLNIGSNNSGKMLTGNSSSSSTSSFDSNANSPNSYSTMGDLFDTNNYHSNDPMDILQPNNYNYQMQSSPPQQTSHHSPRQHNLSQTHPQMGYSQQMFNQYQDCLNNQQIQHQLYMQQINRMCSPQIQYGQMQSNENIQAYFQQQQVQQIQQVQQNVSPNKTFIKQESSPTIPTTSNVAPPVKMERSDSFTVPNSNGNGVQPPSPTYSSASTTPTSYLTNTTNSNPSTSTANTSTTSNKATPNSKEWEDYVKEFSDHSYLQQISIPTDLEIITAKEKEEIARYAYKTWIVIKPGNKVVKDKIWTLYYNKLLPKYHLRDNHLGRKLNHWIEEDLKAYYARIGQDTSQSPSGQSSTSPDNLKKKKPNSSKEGQHPAYLNIDLISPIEYPLESNKPHPLAPYCQNNNVFWTEPEMNILLETFKDNRSKIMQQITPQSNKRKALSPVTQSEVIQVPLVSPTQIHPTNPTINCMIPTNLSSGNIPIPMNISSNNIITPVISPPNCGFPTMPQLIIQNPHNMGHMNPMNNNPMNNYINNNINGNFINTNPNLNINIPNTNVVNINSTKKPIKKRKKGSLDEVSIKNSSLNVEQKNLSTGFSPLSNINPMNPMNPMNPINSNFPQLMNSTSNPHMNTIINNNSQNSIPNMNNCNSLSSSTSSSPSPVVQSEASISTLVGGWVNSEIYKSPDSYWIKIDLPGVPISEIKVSVVDLDNPKILIVGEKYPDQNSNLLLIFGKRNFGPFEIEAKLPICVDAKRARQYFCDGVLSIQCPFKSIPNI